MEQNNILPRWAYALLAGLTGALGLAASIVTARLFIVGLERIEPDAVARDVLIAAGVLMVATEVAALFLAALLPGQRLRAVRRWLLALGLLLLTFECSTIYLTQTTLAQGAQAQHQAQATRIAHLHSAIAAQQETVVALRTNGQTQSASQYVWIRQDGATTLRRAAELQTQTAPMVQELAKLQAQQRPTLDSTLGQTGMLVYTVARAVLICVMGLVMCAAAGALLRAAFCGVPVPVVPKETMPTVPVPVPPASAKWRSVTVPAIGMAIAPMTWAVPAVTVPTVPAPTVPVPAQPKATEEAQEDDAAPAPGPRYAAARAAVLDGNLSVPSVRAIQALVGGNTSTARAIQACLAAEGLIARHGQGYQLASASQGVLL